MQPQDNQENLAQCICEGCKVYNECARGKNEKLYCAKGKSECELDYKKICICGACPVYEANDLKGGFFCFKKLISKD